MNTRHLAVAALLGAATAAAQQPFDLDANFRTIIDQTGVDDLLELPDGNLIISGNMLLPGITDGTRSGALLHADGSLADSYSPSHPHYGYMGGSITPWDDRFYVGNGTAIRRLWLDGRLDTSYHLLDANLNLLQGGDYHVYPDGRVLMTGYYGIFDNLGMQYHWYGGVWLTAEGYVDTTRDPVNSYGPIFTLQQLPNGKFMCNGGGGMVDGRSVSTIFRINVDGALDTTFNAPFVDYGNVYRYFPQSDGKVICGGQISFVDDPDTIALFRLLPNGVLDPTFNNQLAIWTSYRPWDRAGPVLDILPIGSEKLVITGFFDQIDDVARGGIAMLDTAGHLLDGYFEDEGCGGYWEQSNPSDPPEPWEYYKYIAGITPSLDGSSYYIYGGYHGYDDGTTNDPLQRMVSRLYGLNVGIHEQEKAAVEQLHIAPNPSAGQTTFSLGSPLQKGTLTVHDASGRVVLQRAWPAGAGKCTLQAGALAPGAYVVRVASRASATAATPPAFSGRLVVMP